MVFQILQFYLWLLVAHIFVASGYNAIDISGVARALVTVQVWSGMV